MNTKYLIALFLLITVTQNQTVAVGDSEEFIEPVFKNYISVPNVAKDQIITASFQFNHYENLRVNVQLFLKGTTAGTIVTDSKPCQAATCSVSWASSETPVAGDYWIALTFATAANNELVANKKVTFGSAIVTGNSASRTDKTLVKQTVVVNRAKLHKVYFSTPTSIKITLPYTDNATDTGQRASYLDTGRVKFFSEPSTGLVALVPIVTSASDPNPVASTTTATGTVTWTFQAPAGFSWISFDPAVATTITYAPAKTYAFRFNYFTEVYTCPFLPEYPDVSGIFRGCAFQADLSRLPCVLYNTILSVCTQCYTGYTLVSGRCVEQDCPAGQYKRYGQCLANPLGCDTFNEFTKCTKCSTGFTLANGACTRTPLTCTGRTFFNKATFTCDKVDDKCKEWVADTGACTSCQNPLEKPVAGVCTAVESTCTDKQFVNALLECVNADPLCETFEKFGGKCIKCVWGFDYNATQSKCIKIVCPERFVPNDFGRCVRVSDLCDQFDARGVCSACIPTHALQTNGVCLQIEKPHQCPPRQYLGQDNFCHEVNEFCSIFNRETGACTECVSNYFLMYTGECVLRKQCKSRQVLINNDCHDVSPTCGNFDRSTGKCLNCASEEYELYYGLCIPVSTCGVRQWTDNNGNCFDVSPRCNTFNPSTGECSSCVQGFNYLNGICCLRGEFNENGKCVVAKDASTVSNQNGCISFVNGIGCVRCDEKFERTLDSFGFYFCKAL